MVKKFFNWLKSLPGDISAFIGFGIFVIILSAILFILLSRVSINTEKRATKIEKIIKETFPADTLINFDVKTQGSWMIESKQEEVIPVIYDKVSCGDTVPYISYVEALPRLFCWKLGSVIKSNELPARW